MFRGVLHVACTKPSKLPLGAFWSLRGLSWDSFWPPGSLFGASWGHVMQFYKESMFFKLLESFCLLLGSIFTCFEALESYEMIWSFWNMLCNSALSPGGCRAFGPQGRRRGMETVGHVWQLICMLWSSGRLVALFYIFGSFVYLSTGHIGHISKPQNYDDTLKHV